MFGFLKSKKHTEKSESSSSDITITADSSLKAVSEEPATQSEEKRPQEKNISSALSKTRQGFFSRVKQIFSFKGKLDEESLDEMEAVLIGADVGIKAASELIEEARAEVKNGREINEEVFKALLKKQMVGILSGAREESRQFEPPLLARRSEGPTVVLIIGVNGVGKTTSIAKVAHQLKREGKNIMLCAADTFRAAAVQQLESWGGKIGVPVYKGAPEAKPSTVVYDGVAEAIRAGSDCLLIDTAGRLHNKSNLMSELQGINNSIKRHIGGAPHEVWLVIDGATGQNALNQARDFNEIIPLTGIIVTKLDGTPKGGIIVAISRELNIPIRYVGVGEGIDDLKEFNAEEFVSALFEESDAFTLRGDQQSANASIRRVRRSG